MRVALAHHWLIRPRGGERVLACLARLFPDAPILTSVLDRHAPWPPEIAGALGRVRTTPLQGLYALHPRLLPFLVPLMPLAGRSTARRLRGFDVLLVSEAGLAKCFAVPSGTRKAVYAHTPMRRLWLQGDEPGPEIPRFLSRPARLALRWLRDRDRDAAQGVDRWAANSMTTRTRLARCYGIALERIRVIYPPVWPLNGALDHEGDSWGPVADRSDADPPSPGRHGGLLVVSPMVSYKRDDLAIRAASRLGVDLTVAGDGPERGRLMEMAGSHVRFLGHVDDRRLRDLYRQASGLVFCANEDFGLVPVEAMSAGCPVLAYRVGGATETVQEGVGGLFFDEQTVDSVTDGIRRLLQRTWQPQEIRASVERFSAASFERQIRDWLKPGGQG